MVIGCGNIGALYDFNNDQVQTHAKAYHLDSRFSLSVFDIDTTVAKTISTKYNAEIVDVIDEVTLHRFDCVSICTPTDTHFHLLTMAVDAGVRVIICEKPISNNSDELDKAKSIYFNGKSKIIVNYIRRFQPSFIELKNLVSEIMAQQQLTNINIKYQRGFINNCSHAFDSIEFLIGDEMNLTEVKRHNVVYDHFDKDSTLSLMAIWNKVNLSIIGLSNVCFSHFEFDLYFEYHKICIKNSGQNIEIYRAVKGEHFLQPLTIQDQYTRDQCLKNYMVNVIDMAYQLLNKEEQKDNFLQSIGLNQRMLNYIND